MLRRIAMADAGLARLLGQSAEIMAALDLEVRSLAEERAQAALPAPAAPAATQGGGDGCSGRLLAAESAPAAEGAPAAPASPAADLGDGEDKALGAKRPADEEREMPWARRVRLRSAPRVAPPSPAIRPAPARASPPAKAKAKVQARPLVLPPPPPGHAGAAAIGAPSAQFAGIPPPPPPLSFPRPQRWRGERGGRWKDWYAQKYSREW